MSRRNVRPAIRPGRTGGLLCLAGVVLLGLAFVAGASGEGLGIGSGGVPEFLLMAGLGCLGTACILVLIAGGPQPFDDRGVRQSLAILGVGLLILVARSAATLAVPAGAVTSSMPFAIALLLGMSLTFVGAAGLAIRLLEARRPAARSTAPDGPSTGVVAVEERQLAEGRRGEQGRVGIDLAVPYYVIAGLIAGGFAFGLAQELESDSVLGLIAASAVSATLLITARRLRRDPSRLGLLVGVGVVVGIVVAALPVFLILSMADLFGSISVFGPQMPTVNLVLPLLGPLLWSLASAVAVWRHARRSARAGSAGTE